MFVFQVVELISSAIGDLVQGVYYENSAEVRHATDHKTTH